ncbi:MAG TPA: FKBP-type peptidyl-prolyl cis-trans isomerase [Paludibacteraceae bacterium]|jgi:FKBP-type peptidyl-prolyl cis-trans isomerase|nr:FKBP-type peptidyl-prolyl cis-trans isomerase [Paludibacteraceae bacterium]HOU69233.1 FKBP-type peptidyl-prolyl cis-trans isomerase [Paludibacteraceae bacterium]HPH63156.1 FKBP-type peptidyl-prolyl cis-trans isomerase [Paludibacteraceae bacterium]HQF50996.1 FKBP-type peptidyl-prolyl cis-trans isomerase [Paludibacteraceae bacterium]
MKNFKIWTLCLFSFLFLTVISSCSDDDDEDVEDVIKENKATKEAGELYMYNNKLLPSVKETYSGLQYIIKSKGEGENPALLDSVTLIYTASLMDGTVFESTVKDLLVAHQIEGLKEGLRYMKEGSYFTLYIPYYLGFGTEKKRYIYAEQEVVVSPYSVLVYECYLARVKHND